MVYLAVFAGLIGCPGCHAKEGAVAMTITVRSTAFGPQERIPKKYTGEGTDVSPPLAWSNLPEGTQELALICDDPDAPTSEPWVHWVIYKIPVAEQGLPEGVEKIEKPSVPSGAVQGKNSWPSGQNTGYRGPMPPPGHGTHHYHFTLYALKNKLDVGPGLDKKTLLSKMSGLILAQGRLTGVYSR
jgi:Raf kinase inhibitor-like YbhB/YbcL family protein